MFEMSEQGAVTPVVVEGQPAIVFWDQVAFVAICLKHDIAAQGPTFLDAVDRLGKTIVDEKFLLGIEGGGLSSIEEPPRKYRQAAMHALEAMRLVGALSPEFAELMHEYLQSSTKPL